MHGVTDEQLKRYEREIERFQGWYEGLRMKSPLTADVMMGIPFMAQDVQERFKGVPIAPLLFLSLMAIHTELHNIETQLEALNSKFEARPGRLGYSYYKDSLEQKSRADEWSIRGVLERIALNTSAIIDLLKRR